MGIFYYLMFPFTWLLNFFYNMSGNYGVDLICFIVVVKLVLFPFQMKGKKGSRMRRMFGG